MTAVAAVRGGASKAGGAVRPEKVLGALRGRIDPVRVGFTYRLGLLLVAVAMLVLPLVYVALVAGVCYSVYWYAVHGVVVLGGRGGGRLKLFAYLGPLAIGLILVFFMVKPLFARRPKGPRPISLGPGDEPVLFAFVHRLCEIVGAPAPKWIDVDCQVNASASFHDGAFGWLRRDLVLTIGLPLAAGLDLRQLTGVLAHEFGHFAQGTGMRLTYVIRSVNGWFARVVYQRDAFDVWLVNAQREFGHTGVALVFLLARLFVWLTRRVLWVLMIAGHAISSFMLRQMEFDADRYEARVAGAEAFAQTAERLRMLDLGCRAAMNDLEAAWRERRLCDDLPVLVRCREADLPDPVRKLVRQHGAAAATGWLDTHPSDADRVASVRRENAPGVFANGSVARSPASVLFADFEALSRRATVAFYRQALDRGLRPENLVTTASLVEARGKKKQTHESLRRYFQGVLDPTRPVFPDLGLPAPKDTDDAAEIILNARTTLTDVAPRVAAAGAQVEAAEKVLAAVARVRALESAGVRRLDPKEFDLPGTSYEELAAAERRARADYQAARRVLDPAAQAGAVRLQTALALEAVAAGAPAEAPSAGAVAEAVTEDGYEVDEVGAYDLADEPAAGSGDLLKQALRALREAAPGVEQLRQHYYVLGALLSRVRPQENAEELVREVLDRSRKAAQQIGEIHATLRTAPYPYEHAEKGASVARYALELVPLANEVGNVYGAAEAMIEAVYSLYMRIMADLAHRAEQVESSLGLPPLPEPPDSSDTGNEPNSVSRADVQPA